MRVALISLVSLLCLAGCSNQIKQFYPDSYFNEDAVYQNKPLRFSLTFFENWRIDTDPNLMMRSLRNLAKDHHKKGGELLFVGQTVDGLQGVKGVAVNLNISTEEYAENIQSINQKGITEDSGLTEIIINEKPMVRWSYKAHDCQFVEFFLTLDTYNLRIAFWAQPVVFESFYPVYLEIMSSLEFISRY